MIMIILSHPHPLQLMISICLLLNGPSRRRPPLPYILEGLHTPLNLLLHKSCLAAQPEPPNNLPYILSFILIIFIFFFTSKPLTANQFSKGLPTIAHQGLASLEPHHFVLWLLMLFVDTGPSGHAVGTELAGLGSTLLISPVF